MQTQNEEALAFPPPLLLCGWHIPPCTCASGQGSPAGWEILAAKHLLKLGRLNPASTQKFETGCRYLQASNSSLVDALLAEAEAEAPETPLRPHALKPPLPGEQAALHPPAIVIGKPC